MSRSIRAGVVFLAVALLAAVTFFGSSRGDDVPPPAPQVPPPGPPMGSPPGGPPSMPPKDSGPSDAVTLPTDRLVKKKLEAAADYLKVDGWNDSLRLLQGLIDANEDVFVQVTRPDKDGKPGNPIWVSARSEAERMVATLTPKGMDNYQLQYGPAAKARLEEAVKKQDPALLEDVIRRYFYTPSGGDALALLAAYHLDRGRPDDAASLYARLLQRPGAEKLEGVTLLRAAVAFHQDAGRKGDDEEEALRRLAAKAGPNGVVLGNQAVPLEQLRREVAQLSRELPGAHDKKVARGDERRSSTGVGDVPSFDLRWQQFLSEDKKTREWLDRAVRTQEDSLLPVLPGALPLVVADKVICRSPAGVVAYNLKDGRPVWHTTLAMSLESCAKDGNRNGTVENWMKMYTPGGGIPFGQLGNIGGWGGAFPVPGGVPVPGMGGPGFPGGLNMGGPGWGMNLGGPPGGFPAPGAVGPVGTVSPAPSLVYDNTVLGTLSTDHRRVYAVDDMPVPLPLQYVQMIQQGAPQPLAGFTDSVYFSKLKALDLETGQVVWELGSRKGKDDLAESYFLGPPLPLNGRLFTLIERHGEIRLLCLDAAKGEVLWNQMLAAGHEKIFSDLGRRLQALHLAYADGVLVCPTNVGVVVGVDPLSRSLLWAYAYRDKQPVGPDGIVQDYFNPVPVVPSWRMTTPIISVGSGGGKVVFTAPDNEAIHCINLKDGTPVWKVNRNEDDLYVAGVFDGPPPKDKDGKDPPPKKTEKKPGQPVALASTEGPRVVIVGRSGCRALALEDGNTQVWHVATGLPSGLGVGSGKTYYLPLRAAAEKHEPEVCVIDVEKGVITAHSKSRKHEIPGNLLFHEGDVLSQSVDRVTVFPQAKVKLALMNDLLAKNPKDPQGLTERGTLKLDQGDLAGAVADLRTALHNNPPADVLPETNGKLYEALTQLLQRDFKAGSEYLDDYKELCKVPVPPGATPDVQMRALDEQRRREINYLCLVARGREQSGGLSEALQAYRELHAKGGDANLITTVDDPLVKARLDVWARGRVAALLEKMTAAQRKDLEDQLGREWQALRAADDVEGLGRFVALFGPTASAGKEARLQLAEMLTAERERSRFLEAELQLLQVYHHTADPRQAARALDQLARLLADKGLLEDAVSYYRLLARDYAKVEVADGKTGAAIWDDLGTDKRFLPYLTESSSSWGTRWKVDDPKKMFGGGVNRPVPQLLNFDPAGDPAPSVRGSALTFDLNSSQFRFVDRHSGQERWRQKVTLDGVRAYLLQSGYANLRLPYQVQGHLGVVNLGTVAFGLDLIDGRVLWRRQLVDSPFDQNRFYVEYNPQLGFRTYLLNQTGQGGANRLIAALGPVASGYVAVHTVGGLVTLDPVRGEPQWVRTDVAAESLSFGDDEMLCLVENNGSSGRALRARDGLAVKVPDFVTKYQSKVQQFGCRLLLVENEGNRVVHRLYDAGTGKDVWKKIVPARSVLLHSVDPTLLGRVDPDGKVHVFEARSGKEVLKAAVDPRHLDQVREIHLLHDRSRFYVAINGPLLANTGVQGEAWQFVQNMETVPVHGMVYCFDAQSGEVQWYNLVQHQQLLLEKFEEMPILLFVAGVNRETVPQGNVQQKINFHSIDRQTGKRLLHQDIDNTQGLHQPLNALTVDPINRRVELVGPTMKVKHEQ
jgi:outer membrane protein assembly factor BamB/tetratricopeptide (TPR) repeat protein